MSEYFSDVSFAPAMALASDATERDLCYGAAVVSNPKREGTAARRGGVLVAC